MERSLHNGAIEKQVAEGLKHADETALKSEVASPAPWHSPSITHSSLRVVRCRLALSPTLFFQHNSPSA